MADSSSNKLHLADVRAELDRLAACRDDHERIGVSRDADAVTARRVFVEASRPFHPDLHNQRDARFRELVEEVFIQLSEAERRLRKQVKRTSRSAPARANPEPATQETRKGPRRRRTEEFGVPTIPATPRPATDRNAVPDALLRRLGLKPDNGEAAQSTPANDTIPPRSPMDAPSYPVPRVVPEPSMPSRVASAPAPDIRHHPLPPDTVFVSNPPVESIRSAVPPPPVPAAEDPALTQDVLFGDALSAMIERRYADAVTLLDTLVVIEPSILEYQTARELSQGYLQRDRGVIDGALVHFHRACVLDGACTDAIDAIRALNVQASRSEEQLLGRLLGDGN